MAEDSKVDSSTSLQFIKGQLAEYIVKKLLQDSGYIVSDFGMEKSHPEILGKIGKDCNNVSKIVRRMPDFLIISPDGEKHYMLEVKYRKDGKLCANDLHGKDATEYYFAYENVYVIMISLVKGEAKINLYSVNEILGKKELEKDPKFTCEFSRIFADIDNDLVKQYCNWIQLFYSQL